jgi:UDP-N-acetylglucosamine 2-epimerase (non-hydrolysing)
MRQSESSTIARACASANRAGRPLYLVVLATKPCYIKLASLIHALRQREVPFLLIDTGQHYEPVLSSAKIEFNYEHLIGVYLNIRGGLLARTADLARKLQRLAKELQSAGLRQPPVPVVSGDTSTSAFMPQFWYLLTGYRSVHVEAGLRSLGPVMGWKRCGVRRLLSQRRAKWRRFRDEPFPEGIDTALASVASDLLLAPVTLNAKTLVEEGYDARKIHVVGSLSADASRLALSSGADGGRAPAELSGGKWLRVDIHRRENTTPARLQAILRGVAGLSESGVNVVLVRTNALDFALERHPEAALLPALRGRPNFLVQKLWPSYLDVIRFLNSPNCLGVFTDSGGLQEETNVLGVPCVTCRYSTDRPETVLDGASNILLPPESPETVRKGLEAVFSSDPAQIWPGLGKNLYGDKVGDRIAKIMGRYVPPPAAKGAEVVFA